MKRFLFILTSLLYLIPIHLFAQNAKKPTLMLIPSDTWCNQQGYVKKVNEMGETKILPDYSQAIINSSELKSVTAIINSLMKSRGFPLIDLEAVTKQISTLSAEDAVTTSKSGQLIAESPLDLLKKRAKCDIILDLHWEVNAIGPRRSITYTLKGLDAYTNKQIAGFSGTSEPTMTSETSLMLQEAVHGSMDEFTNQLMEHFEDMAQRGREVSLRVKVFEGAQDLESEIGGKALSEIIEDWVNSNTVNNVYSLTDATENILLFEQVRIPLHNVEGRALDTRQWARGLAKHLNSMGIKSKLMLQGLGMATIIIGN